jgi:putative endonuclease
MRVGTGSRSGSRRSAADPGVRAPCVYILASHKKGTLYVGVTSDVVRPVWEHRSGEIAGFTEKYSVDHLAWFEMHPTMNGAIAREKQIKKWNRAWKVRLIEGENPEWRDLYPEIIG